MSKNESSNKEEHDIIKFQRTFSRVSGALALMVAAVPAAIGWTEAIPTLSDTQQKFSQVNVSVMSFSSIGLIYYYRDAFSSAFSEKVVDNIRSKLLRHTPLYCFVLSIASTYLYFLAYESAAPSTFWPVLAYSGMFVFPAILLATISLKDFVMEK